MTPHCSPPGAVPCTAVCGHQPPNVFFSEMRYCEPTTYIKILRDEILCNMYGETHFMYVETPVVSTYVKSGTHWVYLEEAGAEEV